MLPIKYINQLINKHITNLMIALWIKQTPIASQLHYWTSLDRQIQLQMKEIITIKKKKNVTRF